MPLEDDDLLTTDPDEELEAYYKQPDGKLRLCCCQPDCPHDETNKFVLIGTEEAKQRGIFLKKQKGKVTIDLDIALYNKIPSTIDQRFLIGRNQEVQKIVEYLSPIHQRHRLIHLYGL